MDTLDEHEILRLCALRFDGWKYMRDTGFDWHEALQRYFTAGTYPSKREEQLCLFFMLQRAPYKWWDWGSVPLHRPHWRLFRSLFLLVHDYDVPQEYRQDDWSEAWERRIRPRLRECVDLARRIHDATQYDDGR
ncbi:MAG: hypothetical protein K6V36_11370 [Anaerolineae bacterium]|nr:hypothetical protein [Anaerolineae bacterium]